MKISIIIIAFVVCSCSFNYERVQCKFLSADPCLNADSLKSNVMMAYEVWGQRPWSSDYNDDDVLNYILPPRIADEPVEYYWRSDIPQWLNINYQGEEVLELARKINSVIDVDVRPQDWANKQMGYTATKSGKFGKCDDRAILATMAMRSMGVPAAIDIIPMWGGTNNGHSCCSVILPENFIYTFQEAKDDGTTLCLRNKVPKVYRRTFFEDTTLLTYPVRYTEEIPDLFNDFRLKDVTYEHKVGCRDLEIQASFQTDNNLGYLAIFHPNGWFPIAFGTRSGENIKFRHVGTGTDMYGQNMLKGENIGNGILYLPIIYDNGSVPVGPAFIAGQGGLQFLCPSNETETVILHRKYPKLERILGFSERMIGGVIEVADNADFSDAVPVHYIYDCPLSRTQNVCLEQQITSRYIRFRKPSGTLSIAELLAYDNKGKRVEGTAISCAPLDKSEKQNINDNDPLSYVEVPNGLNLWVGLDLGKLTDISSIGFCPRNDDNDISPGDTYELFYWNDEWISLGEKTADSFEMVYHNVPKNALLWLRNKSKGKEERPFTYENCKQIWW